VFVTYKEVADTMNMLWRGKPKQVAIAIEMENMRLYTTPPQPAPVDIASLVEGMEVSIDVSTGEHDYGNRLFGTVTLVQESQYGKHGLILLVQNPEANFETPQPAQEPVAWMEKHTKQKLLGRVHRELLDVLNSINQDKIHHDGDDFHELLIDVEKALAQPAPPTA
jgi:hypothetical protein